MRKFSSLLKWKYWKLAHYTSFADKKRCCWSYKPNIELHLNENHLCCMFITLGTWNLASDSLKWVKANHKCSKLTNVQQTKRKHYSWIHNMEPLMMAFEMRIYNVASLPQNENTFFAHRYFAWSFLFARVDLCNRQWSYFNIPFLLSQCFDGREAKLMHFKIPLFSRMMARDDHLGFSFIWQSVKSVSH